ncbi:hypothetical protein TNCV_898431 [Trichonephila clavipes]|nr:hypothetical protein TNCV_898431 [Trichonephila clavipes]
MSVIAHQTEKEWISANEKSRQRMSQTQTEGAAKQQPDLRKLICEHIIHVLQHQKDVNQKQHICVKHDFGSQGIRQSDDPFMDDHYRPSK